ncbi:hypothetical protein R5W23_003958 [Gemmata sp. JC673]|uniref:HEAT repeat domain-containing protein n=1 Tax=Gemmata algarum TaxID=2975278 RepID=A0ABU5F4L4_9BACT|nr:hypothetical protein [Gemmata algarum]MDY3562492.1 hypothetical protein [Gemmata algarum]
MIQLRAALFACAALVAAPALGASPDPKDLAVAPEELSKARELVRRLGSESYRDREEATNALAKMGRLARQVLAEAASAETDPEIRTRALRLLPKSEADDLQARIETFLADKDSKFEHNLPGLKTFRATLGTSAGARALYVDILKSPYNLDMLAAMDRGPVEGGRAVSDRRNTLYSDMIQRNVGRVSARTTPPKQPALADIAAVLLAETVIPYDAIPKATIQWQQVSGVLLFNQNASIMAINGSGAHADVYKVLAGRWLATRNDPQDLSQLVYQLGNGNLRNFPETLPLLRRIVVQDNVQGYAKGQALNFLVQQRGKEEAAFLKAVMRNEVRVGDYPEAFKKGENPDKLVSVGAETMVTQVWFQRNLNGGAADIHTVTVRDVAFAFTITQAGLNMKDFGFETAPHQSFTPTPAGFGQYAFTSEEKRQSAFVKFGWWQMKEGIKKRGVILPSLRDR